MKLALLTLGLLLSQRIAFGQLFVAWGDSLTFGYGGTPWPTQFASDTGASILNQGVSGETSGQIKGRFFAEPSLFGDHVVIWAGRNNYGQTSVVESDIAAMVLSLTTPDYLVLAVINGDYGTNEAKGGQGYTAITTLNAHLAATYGSRFLDIRQILVDSYDPLLPEDVADFANDIPPASLRSDELHMNSAGYAVVAKAVETGFALVPEPSEFAAIFASGSVLAALGIKRFKARSAR